MAAMGRRAKTDEPPRFVVDHMLLKLGKYLRVLGYDAVWDRDARAFVEFDLVALGVRWGFTRFNGRRGDPGPSAVGFAVGLAPAHLAGRVAPGTEIPADFEIEEALVAPDPTPGADPAPPCRRVAGLLVRDLGAVAH